MIKGPLNGITVLDLTRVLAGPYCTNILYNLGARIIKVENPQGGDDSRQFPPFVNGESAYSCALNHGKESIALNIKNNADDKIIFEKLIRNVDVLVENFRPGVLSRLGYDEKKLASLNSQLIIGRISGFGKSGPEAMRACYDLVAQGISGLISMTGEEDGHMVKAGIELGDISAGVYAALGICAALFDRTRTKQGMAVGTALIDSLVSFMPSAFSRYSIEGIVPKPIGSRHSLITPFNVYITKDKPIVICAANNHLFEKLCIALGKPELFKDPRFINNPKRVEHTNELEDIMTSILKTKTVSEWLTIFNEINVPAGPINTMADVFQEPQILYRNMVAHYRDGFMPEARFPGNPIKFSNYSDTDEYPRGPRLDEHREEILKWLGSVDH